MARHGLSWTLLVMMAATAWVGHAYQPTEQRRAVSAQAEFLLERDIPTSFAGWKVVPSPYGVVSSPEIQELIDRVYSQTIMRTYVNASGYRIMLSIAYGEDQRGGLQAHRPEVCYPAQGFQVLSNEDARITTPAGAIVGRRLLTRQGGRVEPLTYWLNVGSKPVMGRLERRVEEIRLVMTGKVPDGLLFRVSSIDPDTPQAMREQERFIADLVMALPAQTRKRISGL